MATWYVYHGGDNSPGYGTTDREDPTQSDNWSNAFQSLNDAFGTVVAGDLIYVAHDHYKDYAADTTITSPGTAIAPIHIVCVNRSSGVYAQTAEEATDTGVYDFLIYGSSIIHGIKFTAGGYIRLCSTNDTIIINDSFLRVGNQSTSTYYVIVCYGSESLTILNNTDISFSGSGQKLDTGVGRFVWNGGSVIADSLAPTYLFNGYGLTNVVDVELIGIDLSECSYLLDNGGEATNYGGFKIKCSRCLISSGFAISDGTPWITNGIAELLSIDDSTGDDINRFWIIDGQFGEAKSDTGVYLNAAFSAELSSWYTKEWFNPFRFKLCSFVADANPTITIECITDGVTLNNDDFWVEIEYPDSTDPTLGQIDASSKMTNPTDTPAALTSSSASWTESLTTPTKQKISKTISGGGAGVHTVWACLAKPSTTVYVDPMVTVS